jgi:spore coat protein U-like protein
MNLSKSFKCAAVFGVLALGFTTAANEATTVTATIAVSATVNASCGVSANPVPFGTYIGVAVPITSSVSVSCSPGTTYTLALDKGTTSGGAVTARLMQGPGTATLSYGLYTDSGHANNFGTQPTATGTGAAQVTNVYGYLPANQFPTPGSYADTVTASVTY